MSIQALGKQSLIYGFGHILTRLITFFLLPLYTHMFTPEEYGVVSLVYAFMGLALILYRYGMDSALMKYAVQKESQERGEYISTIYGLQVISGVIFSCILFFSKNIIAKTVLGVDQPEWIAVLSGVLLLDALWNLPVLLLRTEEKPVSFIAFNLINVLSTMGFNIFFVVILKMGILGVLIANLGASSIMFILSLPIIMKRVSFSSIQPVTLKIVLKFSIPFLPAGIFTMIMELGNRYLLFWMAGTQEVGLYSAGYKLGIFGLVVVMGFNMGWTPYFLKRGKEVNAKKDFSQIATFFLGLLGFVIVAVSLWVPEIMRFPIGTGTLIGKQFWSAENVIFCILFAYFFFGTYVIQLPGIFMREITNWIPIFRAIGATVNIALNILLIPRYGVIGSAWATVFAFLFMSLSVFIRSHKIYPVPYNWFACLYPAIFMGIVFITGDNVWVRLAITFFYPAAWFLFVINDEERAALNSLIS
ncbi:MAG: oligosaccharide flippase family protein [Candidatus Marinimicrobia bacterium]|jgi:O-antigen/teichoic acid export membrane protein|nr:oligosaccharide flippase family protein [Candidatus Neomarinimicrobiota bacterium]